MVSFHNKRLTINIMEAADYGKMAKWLINEGYGNELMPLFNKVFANGKDSMFAIRSLEGMPPAQNLYSSLKDMGLFKPDAVSEEEFNKNIFSSFKSAGGDVYMLGQMGGAYRKKGKGKGKGKRKTSKKGSKKAKKTRRH
jgi:hypothetical protein